MRSLSVLLILFMTSVSFGSAQCSANLFSKKDDKSIELPTPTREQTASLIQEIVHQSVRSNEDYQVCTAKSSSCYAIDGDTYYDTQKIYDGMGRYLGSKGSIRMTVARLPDGMSGATVDETYYCAWGSALESLCRHYCSYSLNPDPGS